MDEVELGLDLSNLVSVARVHLYWLFGQASEVGPEILQGPPFARLNVTLRVQGAVRGSMSGSGETLREQLLDAVCRASRDSRFFGSIVKADLDQLTVEVWLQISSEVIPFDGRDSEGAFRLGVDGIEIEQGTAFAYYKPSVAVTSRFKSCHDMFSALCKKAKLPDDAWKSQDCILRKTTWIHLCETPDRKVIKMTALRPSDPIEITDKLLSELVRSSAGYLMSNQYSDGSFCYEYHPILNRTSRRDTHPVRASGCAYAIAEAASSPYLCSDKEMKACAERAVDAILRRAVQFEHGGMYIADSLKSPVGGKLGTTALLLLALLTPELRLKYEQEVTNLVTGIKFAQLASGLFECSFGESDSADSQINFFPGQAILALVVRAQQGDESCRDSYRKAFVPYRDHFRGYPATAFVGWQADAWTRAALLDSNAEYADFVFEQTDWLLQFQLRPHLQSIDSGGFSWNGNHPNYSSIVYTEAIARAADLAYRVNDSRWARYRDAFRDGLSFCSRLWLTKDQSAFFPNPLRAIGGVATNISDLGIRSDFVQHGITLALATLERPVLLATAASKP